VAGHDVRRAKTLTLEYPEEGRYSGIYGGSMRCRSMSLQRPKRARWPGQNPEWPASTTRHGQFLDPTI